MPDRLVSALWPEHTLGQLLEALARRAGLQLRAVEIEPAPQGLNERGLTQWMEDSCGRLGLESEPVLFTGQDVEEKLSRAGPAILCLPGGHGFVGLLLARRGIFARQVRLLAPDLSIRSVPLEELRSALCRKVESPYLPEIEQMMQECAIPAARRAALRAALLRERLRSRPVGTLWQLQMPPGSSFSNQLRKAGLLRRMVAFAGLDTAEYALWILSWWMVGKGALEGRLDSGWLLAWALVLLSIVPVRMLAIWSQGLLAVGLGGLLKQRLLAGALRLNPDQMRHQGAGQLLGRVIESEAVETMALSGGLMAWASCLELVLAAAVLWQGAGEGLHALLLVLWVALTLSLGWMYARTRSRWTDARLEMTHDLVEHMTGQRTRLAQQLPAYRHEAEDQALDRYLRLSSRLDRHAALLSNLVPNGWLVVGLAGLAPAFLAAQGSTAELAPRLAIGLGGLLLAYRALHKLALGLTNLVGAAISWQRVTAIFQAAAQAEEQGSLSFSLVANAPNTVLEAHDMSFRYRDRAEPVLRGVNLRICRGDWLLLEGHSGGGKSTLASLLAGLRTPHAGLLLAGGLDRRTLGHAGWRRRVVAAPQYHENHVLAAPLAFNLLMGRHWPPSPEDLREAETVCRELGLGELLQRMPGGLQQMVGETGWQLSQGERSRVFMARSLLQGGDLIILDESFAALDPENLRHALECVLRRAPTLLAVAHP